MALNNNNPDLLYQKSREQLLPYEDARLNSLLQAVADFYVTRNDQSIWGNFLRGLAVELARLDYDYSYDLVNKDPSLLTPPDIRRRWAAPLYVSSNWPSANQTDVNYKQMLVELLEAYRMGTTVAAIQDVIFAYTGLQIQVVELYKEIGNGIYDQSDRNSISVSVQVGTAGANPLSEITSLAQLQIVVQSLYGAIALAKPAHVGIEFTTVFGIGEDLDCLISPQFVTQQQFVQLSSVEQAYYTLTGYVLNSPALFWKKSTGFVLGNVLRDSNGNFQQLTDIGVFPYESGGTVPTWSTLSGGTTVDGNLTWINISPAVLSTAVESGVVTVALNFQPALSVGTVVTLINLTGLHAAALNGVPLTVTGIAGATFTAATTVANYTTETETTSTATFPLPSSITQFQFNQLNPVWQALYEHQYTIQQCCQTDTDGDVICSAATPLQPWYHPGMNDTLRIFVQQSEAPPYGPMLIQAPVLNPANPKTTIAAYGKVLCPSLTPTQWLSLPTIFVNVIQAYSDGTNATYYYVPTTQFLHENEVVTIQGFSNAGLNVTARIHDVYNSVATINATAIEADVLTVYAPNSFAAGMLVNLAGLTSATFLNGQTLIITSAEPTSFTAAFAHTSYAKATDNGTGEVSTFQIPNTTIIALQNATPSANAGFVAPTLQSAYYLVNGTYVLGQPPIATTGAGIGSSWVPTGTVFQGQIIVDPNGNQQIALKAGISNTIAPTWMLDVNASTSDGSVVWRNVGQDYFSAPNIWVGILDMSYEVNGPDDTAVGACTVGFTGEVGNVDPNHQYGLVAPRLNQVWEISGNPQDQDFIFGLY
jgi:hypothetical protein